VTTRLSQRAVTSGAEAARGGPTTPVGGNNLCAANLVARLQASRRTLLARQLTKSTVLSAQISTLDTSADLPSAYFPRRST
jgi:hypothetical protein